MDPVLSEMLVELHERMLQLRRQLGDRLIGHSLTAFYRMDAMYHVLLEEIRDGHYLPSTTEKLEYPSDPEETS